MSHCFTLYFRVGTCNGCDKTNTQANPMHTSLPSYMGSYNDVVKVVDVMRLPEWGVEFFSFRLLIRHYFWPKRWTNQRWREVGILLQTMRWM